MSAEIDESVDVPTEEALELMAAACLSDESDNPMPELAELLHEGSARIRSLIAALSAANAREKKLTEALEKIDAMCPPMPPHPGEGEYDFSSAYFNTSDDYAYHVKMRAKAAVGDIARAALQAPAQDGETK